MKTLYLVGLYLFFALNILQAQNQKFEWAQQNFGSISDGQNVVTDYDGNSYITGVFYDTVDFDPGPNVLELISPNQNADIYVQKFDEAGNFMWVKQIKGNGFESTSDIAVDDEGNVYLAGNFNDTIDVDPGSGVINLIPSGNSMFVLKLDTAGNLVWVNAFQGGSVLLRGMSSDPNNNILLTGFFQGTVDFDPGPGVQNLSSSGGRDVFILKLTSDGSLNWAYSIGGSGSDDGTDIATDSEGNVLVVGFFQGTIDFDPGAGISNVAAITFSSNFVLKLDSTGTFVFAHPFKAVAFGVGVDRDRNVFVTGYLEDSVDFNPGPDTSYVISNGLRDGFVISFDEFGEYRWGRNIGGTSEDFSYAVSADSEGNIYNVGSFSGTLEYATANGPVSFTSEGSNDIFILKLDTAGNYLWGQSYGGFAPDSPYDVHVDQDDNVFTTGVFYDIVDFNHGSGVRNLDGFSDMFLFKLSACTALSGVSVLVACDSLTWDDGITYTLDTDTASFTYLSYFGCDSIVDLNLTVNASNVVTVADTITQGESYTLPSGNVVTTTGSYVSNLVNLNNCDSTITTELFVEDTVVIVPPVGILELVEASFNIYPNPSSSKIFIESDEEVRHVLITDIIGNIHLSVWNTKEIELSSLQAGVYIVVLNEEFTYKLVVQ